MQPPLVPPDSLLDSLATAPPSKVAEAVWGALAWLGEKALDLLAVEAGLWVGLLMILLPLIPLRVLWEQGARVPATRVRFKSALSEAWKLAALLFFFTVAGNSVPLLGWMIIAAWSGAIIYVLRLAVGALSKGGADGLDWFSQIVDEAKRRNLMGMQGHRSVPAAGPPDPDYVPGEDSTESDMQPHPEEAFDDDVGGSLPMPPGAI